MGRPSTFTDALAEEICARLADGESLVEICHSENIPSRETVRRWLRDDVEFRGRYARAREEQADFYADEIIGIASDGRNDWEERENARTGATFIALNAEAVQRSRLRVDTLKWVMSKLAPKKYGDKIDVEHSGDMRVKVTIGGDPNA